MSDSVKPFMELRRIFGEKAVHNDGMNFRVYFVPNPDAPAAVQFGSAASNQRNPTKLFSGTNKLKALSDGILDVPIYHHGNGYYAQINVKATENPACLNALRSVSAEDFADPFFMVKNDSQSKLSDDALHEEILEVLDGLGEAEWIIATDELGLQSYKTTTNVTFQSAVAFHIGEIIDNSSFVYGGVGPVDVPVFLIEEKHLPKIRELRLTVRNFLKIEAMSEQVVREEREEANPHPESPPPPTV